MRLPSAGDEPVVRSSEDEVRVGPEGPESNRAVARWISAFNQRDTGAMLACLDADIELHPLRLTGVGGPYHGHDGVREWLGRLEAEGHDHRMVVAESRELGPGRVLVAGSLTVGGVDDVGPFCGVFLVQRELIVLARHYLTDADLVEHLGL